MYLFIDEDGSCKKGEFMPYGPDYTKDWPKVIKIEAASNVLWLSKLDSSDVIDIFVDIDDIDTNK